MISLIDSTDKTKTLDFFSLGNLPLVNNLTDTFEESINCQKYPLELALDIQTGIVSLKDAVNSDLLFHKYLYLSGTSFPYVNHCKSMLDYLMGFITLTDGDTLVDIGGNDGTLLKSFQSKLSCKLNLVNIDPSDVVFYSDDSVEIINSYFNKYSVEKVGKKSRIITTTNVFQHLIEINSFVENVSLLLDDEGIWCLEFPYWYESMKTLQFDQIYHEHVYYYNVLPLMNLFKEYGLRIFDISNHKIHGGSLRMLICKNDSSYVTNESVSNHVKDENSIDVDFYQMWSEKVNNHVNFCKKEILKISETQEIVAFGAAAKGCVFLNYLELDYNHISFIIDDTTLKQNKYMPGTGLKIYEREKIKEKQPDYILILAHNFKDYIINSLRESGYQNKFIVCLPEFEIID
jgi:hypothetical protein